MVDYDDMERPVEDENEPLRLVFGVTLQQIIDVVIQFIYNFSLFILTYYIKIIINEFNFGATICKHTYIIILTKYF